MNQTISGSVIVVAVLLTLTDCGSPLTTPLTRGEATISDMNVNDSSIRASVRAWIRANPGSDAEDVSRGLGIGLGAAVDLVEGLAAAGELTRV